MDWINSYFDDLYLKYFLLSQNEERTKAQVDFIETFFNKGSYLLDAGCGIGRHSIELARRGFKVLGVDFNKQYIEIANQTKEKENLNNIDFEVADIRALNKVNEFDGVLSLWSSFGYFDDDTNDLILKNFFNALKEGGKVIIDVENRDYILKFFIRETFKEKEDGVFILERRKFDPVTSVVTTHRYIIGQNLKKDYIRRIRIYSLTELIYMLKKIGFKNFQYFGGYSKEPFKTESERIILIGEK